MLKESTQKKPKWHSTPVYHLQILLRDRLLSSVLKEFSQPDWCDHPDALDKTFGCSTLVNTNTKRFICDSYCSRCDMYKFYERNGKDKNNSSNDR